nr:ribonuclease H-like domain, reverse transcriptase, RNA-dependent DNA polymerase [Tanacetum cinerariifolium]
GFEDPTFQTKSTKWKRLSMDYIKPQEHGLQVKKKSDGTFISQDKYVADILKKFDFVTVKTASTPMESNKPLTKDKEAEDVDVHLYRSMIGSLMYLTASRLDITFVVCTCARLVIAKDGRCFVNTSEVTTDETFHKEKGDRMERSATTSSSFEAELMLPSIKLQLLVLVNAAQGTTCLPNEEIFKGLACMGAKTTAWNEFSSTMASAIICLADNQKFNFSNMMVQAVVDMGDTLVETHQPSIVDQPSTSRPQKKQKPRRKHRKEAEVSPDESEHEDNVPTPSSDPLHSGEDSYKLHELMVFCTSLQEHVFDLQEAKDAQRLMKIGSGRKVKTPLEKASLGAQEDASKQGRMIEKIDQDDKIALDADTQGRKTDDEMFRVDDISGEEVVTTIANKGSAAPTTDVTEDEITMAQALAALKSVKPTIPAAATKVTIAVPTLRAKGIVFHEQKQSHILTVSSLKDKGKDKMIEPEVPIKKKDHIRMDEEYARQLKAEEQEASRLSRAQQNEEAKILWDNTQAMMEADSLLAERLQAREREEFSKVQQARMLVELIEKRKKHFAALRAQEKRNKPPIKAQMRSQMCTYLRNMGGYKHSYLKGRSYDKVKNLFDREMRKINSFIAMDSEAQKSNENVRPVIDDTEELKKCMEIVLDDGDEERRTILIRADGNSQVYQTFEKMFKNFNREDVEVLWAIAKEKFKKEKPVDNIDNLLFKTLKPMFEHNVEDVIWTYQQGLAKVKNWKLYESYGVYCITMQSIIYYLLVEKVKVFGYILLLKTNILIKKLEDSEDKYQVWGRIIGIKGIKPYTWLRNSRSIQIGIHNMDEVIMENLVE